MNSIQTPSRPQLNTFVSLDVCTATTVKTYFSVDREHLTDFFCVLVPFLFAEIERKQYTEVFLDSKQHELMSSGMWVKKVDGHSFNLKFSVLKENGLMFYHTSNQETIQDIVRSKSKLELGELVKEYKMSVKRFKYALRRAPSIVLTYEEAKLGENERQYSLFSLGTSFQSEPNKLNDMMHNKLVQDLNMLLEFEIIKPSRSKAIEMLRTEDVKVFQELQKSGHVMDAGHVSHSYNILLDGLFMEESEDLVRAEDLIALPHLSFEMPKKLKSELNLKTYDEIEDQDELSEDW